MTLRIFFSPASPFVRKAMVAAHERGVEIEKLPFHVIGRKVLK